MDVYRTLCLAPDGEFIGVEVSAIKPGSLFERAGLESGDVITELNGIEIDSPAKSAAVLQEFARATEFTVTVEGADGTETLTFTLPEDDE